MRDINIIVCGVGGQGSIFLTKMIGATAIKSGKEIISSEAHGLARMLGSVSSMIRIGNHSSGSFEEADLIISMEPLEALRQIHLLAENGAIITSDHKVMIDGYPDDVVERLNSIRAAVIDTKKLSEGLGDRARDNVVLYGVFCKKFGIPKDIAEEVIKSFKDVDGNLTAFRAGFNHEI